MILRAADQNPCGDYAMPAASFASSDDAGGRNLCSNWTYQKSTRTIFEVTGAINVRLFRRSRRNMHRSAPYKISSVHIGFARKLVSGSVATP